MTKEEVDEMLEYIREQHMRDLESLLEYLRSKLSTNPQGE